MDGTGVCVPHGLFSIYFVCNQQEETSLALQQSPPIIPHSPGVLSTICQSVDSHNTKQHKWVSEYKNESRGVSRKWTFGHELANDSKRNTGGRFLAGIVFPTATDRGCYQEISNSISIWTDREMFCEL